MARQPFRFSGFNLYAIGHDCLMQRPRLAVIVAGCNDLWANIELQLSLTLGAILDSSSPAAVGVYLSLRNSRAQREALTAAAQVAAMTIWWFSIAFCGYTRGTVHSGTI
jgi:hypothetical protein